MERALVAGLIFSAVGMVAPILLFSGETQIQEVVADPAKYGAWILIAMALVKLALLAVAFKGGFLGGPTFPAIFASTCVALAIGLLFPGLRIDVLIGAVMAGFLMVLFQAPLMVILLTTVMLQAGPELMALIVLAVATVMVVQPVVLHARGASAGGPGAVERGRCLNCPIRRPVQRRRRSARMRGPTSCPTPSRTSRTRWQTRRARSVATPRTRRTRSGRRPVRSRRRPPVSSSSSATPPARTIPATGAP